MKNMIKIVLLLLILLLLKLLSPTIAPAMDTIFGILVNIFIATGLAYVSYPMVKFLKVKGFNNLFASSLTLLAFFGIFVVAGVLIVQLVYPQIFSAFKLIQNPSSSVKWVRENQYALQAYNYLTPYFDTFSKQAMNYFGGVTSNLISVSTKFIADAAMIICLYLYILFDSKRIINKIKDKLGYDSKNYDFLKTLNLEYMKYLKGLIIIIIITVFEYAIVYKLIGHPDWIALAALCAFSNLIPYFGGIIVNLIALATAIFVSPALFVKVLICVIVLPTLEGNVLNPMIHRKTIQISPILLLPSIFIGNSIFGFLGIILSIPTIILFKVVKKYYKDDIILVLKKAWES